MGARGMHRVPHFCSWSPWFSPGPWGSWGVFFSFFGLLVSFIQNSPQLCMPTVLSSLLQFLRLLLLEETFGQVHPLQQRVPSPSLSQWESSRSFRVGFVLRRRSKPKRKPTFEFGFWVNSKLESDAKVLRRKKKKFSYFQSPELPSLKASYVPEWPFNLAVNRCQHPQTP